MIFFRFTDFTIYCQGQEFRVHKAILAGRSHFFDRMFSYDFDETTKNKMTIKDMTPDTVENMLLYIYGDTARQDKWSAEDAMGLLTAADKYNLAGLKYEASASLCNTINIECWKPS